MSRAPEDPWWSQPANACESDRTAEMRAVLDRADLRVVAALLSGFGLDEALEIQRAARVSAALLGIEP